MVYFHVRRSEPGWGKEACRQVWWPEEVELTDVNKSSKRPYLEDLISIMHSYRNWNQQQHPQEVDITVDDSAHSPVIPIPVSSAPASAFFLILPHLKFLQAPFVLLLLHQHVLSPLPFLILPLQLPKVTFCLLFYLRTLLRGNLGVNQFTVVIRGNLYCKPAVN